MKCQIDIIKSKMKNIYIYSTELERVFDGECELWTFEVDCDSVQEPPRVVEKSDLDKKKRTHRVSLSAYGVYLNDVKLRANLTIGAERVWEAFYLFFLHRFMFYRVDSR